MAILILYLLTLVFVITVGRILFTVIHRKGIQKKYAHVFERAAEQESQSAGAQVQSKPQTGIPQEQLKKLYDSGLISKEEYKARLKKQ